MDSGCYQIFIEVTSDVTINIGALGLCRFERGIYVYTGSAMKNLQKRVDRHCRKDKKMRWHIDFLLADNAVRIMKIEVHMSAVREECSRNSELIRIGAEVPVRRFGSSDCNTCPAHLLKIT